MMPGQRTTRLGYVVVLPAVCQQAYYIIAQRLLFHMSFQECFCILLE